jgi:hypothetical protein
MKFKFVMLEPDDPGDRPGALDNAAAVRPGSSGLTLYERREGGFFRRRSLQDGRSASIPVANFTARIVRDLIVDDGAEQQRHFGLEAELADQTCTVSVPASDFTRMSWVTRELGPKAIIFPGQQQHARAAIQSVSDAVRREQIFRHSGWRKCGDQWAYLHAEGGIAAAGPVPGLQVQMPDPLNDLALRLPADQPALVRALRASLRFLSSAPDRITFPLLAAVYRAVLGAVDFSIFVTGRTGVFKTAIAAVCQQHYGPACTRASCLETSPRPQARWSAWRSTPKTRCSWWTTLPRPAGMPILNSKAWRNNSSGPRATTKAAAGCGRMDSSGHRNRPAAACLRPASSYLTVIVFERGFSWSRWARET